MIASPTDRPPHHGARWQRRHAATVNTLFIQPWHPPPPPEPWTPDTYWRDRYAWKHRRNRQCWTIPRADFHLPT